MKLKKAERNYVDSDAEYADQVRQTNNIVSKRPNNLSAGYQN